MAKNPRAGPHVSPVDCLEITQNARVGRRVAGLQILATSSPSYQVGCKRVLDPLHRSLADCRSEIELGD
jgi:hypothetical protein